jgi:1-acyl-sn-glycerol-3-phosphate acyltransferase
MLSFIKFVGMPLFRILFAVEYHGLENVPENGAVILAGNHPSYLDPILVALPIKRTIRFMAWDALFKVPLLGRLIRSLGAFPVDIRRGKGESAYGEALRVLENGHALGIFPEGQRSESGPMGELRTGTARLAIDSGAPIVPITIGGASRAWPTDKRLPKPAKIIVRFHSPIQVDPPEREAHRQDREFHIEVMNRIAASINRSLAPALRRGEAWEKRYALPPANIRTYEWAPLFAAVVSAIIVIGRGTFRRSWSAIWLLPLAYYLYLFADLALLKPSRLAKWIRNSLPLVLIFCWHWPLTNALVVPAGMLNQVLGAVVLAAFFPFFWEDYYTLQRFVRGLVFVYYSSILFLLRWPHSFGLMVSGFLFVTLFSVQYRTRFWKPTVIVTLAALVAVLVTRGTWSPRLIAYAAIPVVALGYIRTFAGAAYDIRRAGAVVLGRAEEGDD